MFRKELRSLFSSLIAYVVVLAFLVLSGLLLWIFPQTNVLDFGYANLDPLFQLAPYLYLVLIPASTMRAFAEERRAGTMEFLFTKPLADWDIILGKYFACLVLLIFATLPTLVYYYTIYELGTPIGNVDTAAVVGSYLGMFFLGAVFTAVGLLSSSLSENQIVAFMLSLFLCYMLYDGLVSLATVNLWADSAYWLLKFGVHHHYEALSKGLIDSRNIVYFTSIIILFLNLTKLSLGSRKW